MNKPNNYEKTNIGNYIPAEVGGHHMIIKQVIEGQKSKTGKPMVVVLFDFAPNDRQPNFMSEEFKNDVRPEKKWPHAGTQYILTEDENGNCSKNLKRFIDAFEKSNDCVAVWGEKWAAQFKNKKIGGVFGEVENDYNGRTTMRKELRWFCNDADAEKADIPAPKYLNSGNSSTTASSTPASDQSGFMAIDENAGEEIPWG